MTAETTEAATPETDAHIGFHSFATVPAEFARKLERERDEWYYKAHANAAFTLEARAERDEARKEAEYYKERYEQIKDERDEAMLKAMEGAK